ncbi:MAG: class I SAM-dependent methyltransferase [Candidatus Dormiibacterota bacterium]
MFQAPAQGGDALLHFATASLQVGISLPDFDDLIAEAESHPMRGWDFTWLGERLTATTLPWDYRGMVQRLARESSDLLDLGTGGGEWLARLDQRPERTVATEGWPPNLAIARTRLGPLGVEVFAYEGPSDNVKQTGAEPPLPFPDGSFHLVADRHESFLAVEVARVLAKGGRFITQQVGDGRELAALMGVAPAQPPRPSWELALACAQVEAAALRVTAGGEVNQLETIADVGALVWYLKAVPWELPGFAPESFRERLLELHELCQRAPLRFERRAFWLLAEA